MKLLNTTASAESGVKYLKNSTKWQANGHKKLVPVPTKSSDYTTYDRAITTVHLIQVDLAVIDPRSPTRWVYSTLAYDGNQSGPTVWSRLVPPGVQWGSDPQTFPAVPQAQSKPPWQTVLAPTDLPEHYGCNKRFAGVVDNPSSSCVSCHMGAYAAAPGEILQQGKNVPLVFVPPSICQNYSAASQSYFSNYKYPMPYPGSTGVIRSAIPLDSSLQLQVAYAEYAQFMSEVDYQDTKRQQGNVAQLQRSGVGSAQMPPGTIHDTIWVPKNTSVVIRLKFLGFKGKSVYHCHILPHEDTGMMQNFLIE